jgi:hypothetical protein
MEIAGRGYDDITLLAETLQAFKTEACTDGVPNMSVCPLLSLFCIPCSLPMPAFVSVLIHVSMI